MLFIRKPAANAVSAIVLFRDSPEQIAGADENPLVVDVLANRAACPGKQLVHVAFRAMKLSRERRAFFAGVAGSASLEAYLSPSFKRLEL
jgi:hypothetical protein